MNLPAMTVEHRESTTAHGLPESNFDKHRELSLACELNHAGSRMPEDYIYTGWENRVLDILIEYIPFSVDDHNIVHSTAEVLGMESWKEVTEFVQNDMCLDFFNLALAYCLKEGQVHKREKGFIDGSGIGYVSAYTKRLKKTLELCFDAKYYYKVERPLVYAESIGLDLSRVANKIHPGHWSYPAGHGTKFLTAVEVLDDVFHLDYGCYMSILIAACVAAMARSGSLIHYPSDNLAGGYFTTLKEFHK